MKIYDDSWNLKGIILETDTHKVELELSIAGDRQKTIKKLKELVNSDHCEICECDK